MKVVLLHGFLGGSWSYEGVLAACRRSHDVFVPTLSFHAPRVVETSPGSLALAGPDSQSGKAMRFSDEIRRLAAEIQRFAAGSRVMLVGYSMGGRLALGVSIHCPHSIAQLVLVSSRRGLDCREERSARISSDERWAQILEQEGLVRFLDQWAAQPLFHRMKQVTAEIWEREYQRRLTHDPQALACALRRLGLGRQPSFARQVRHLQMPVTILAGEHDLKFLELSERLRAELPRAQRIVVEGASHQVLLEAPGWVSRIIDEGYES